MPATLDQITLNVPDISCGHCELTIKEEVGALGGVSNVQPSNVTKTVVIEFDPTAVSVETIRSTLAEAGYPAS
ncbi:MAG: heavy-metal-associated domain-containing protein [Thermomicrobiales bacterium]|nr:heavy-metal-associated domain-containing protein [Thermomicrobiales bacterium]